MSGRIQSMLKKEQLIKINPLFDAAKLREFTFFFQTPHDQKNDKAEGVAA